MGAVEVAFPLDAAVVFASLLLELDAHPLADLEAGWADEADDAFAAIIELDCLSRPEFLHYGRCSSSRGMVQWFSLRMRLPLSLSLSLFVVSAYSLSWVMIGSP